MTKPARFCATDNCTDDALSDGHCALHGSAGHPIARILTANETARRRSERAASNGAPIITLCAEAGCPRAASHGPWCGEHRPATVRAEPSVAVAHDLTRDELAALRAQVEADAAPIFLIAMNWIARQQVAQLGMTPAAFEGSVARIRAELEQGTPA